MRANGRAARVAVGVAGLLPFAGLAVAAVQDELGADPVEAVLHASGLWALRFLIATVAVTPLRKQFGFSWLAPHRRTLGLLAYFYACLHFAIYLSLDLALDFGALAEDVLERPFITIGFTTLLLLTPLAATSTRRAIRRLGRRWTTLHRLVYPAVLLAAVHFYWSAKADVREPLVYGALAVLLLALRVHGARSAAAGPSAAAGQRTAAGQSGAAGRSAEAGRSAAAGRGAASCASFPRPPDRGATGTGAADPDREAAR